MHFVAPSYEIVSCPEGREITRLIEQVARTCYKSEDKIGDGTDLAMVARLVKSEHLAMIEFGHDIVVKFTSNRGFSHELVRHRLASFAQECLTGDTEVRKGKTIKELYDRTSTPHGKTHNKTIHLRSCNHKHKIIPNKIEHVFYKGKAPVYKVTTELGYEIRTTLNHEFMVSKQCFKKLSELNVGDEIMVNGRPCLLKIEDNELHQKYIHEQLSPQEIANIYEVPYRSVLKRLHALGIFVSRLNDKNSEKYNKNHTEESRTKMINTIRSQYENGRTVWNKGLTEFDSSSVAKQADTLRKHHHNNGNGSANSNWKGGVSTNYYMRIAEHGPCKLCGEIAWEIHHIDEDRTNNSKNNLIRVCINCHQKLHHGWHVGKVAHPDKITSIEYDGVHDVYDIEMEAPFHNYIANGFVVHNSTRYCNYNKDKFGNAISITPMEPEWLRMPDKPSTFRAMKLFTAAYAASEESYLKLVKMGVPAQIAREVLPIGLKAEINIKTNIREWRHILRLRCSNKAHPRMRQLMLPLLHDLHERIPLVFDDLAERYPLGQNNEIPKDSDAS